MNLLECIARVGIKGSNVPNMLGATKITDKNVEETFQYLLENFLEEMFALLCNHTTDEYICDSYYGEEVNIEDVLEDEFFILDGETEVSEERRQLFTEKLNELLNTDVYNIEFDNNTVIYEV